MTELAIGRLNTRLRLPRTDADQAARLRRLLAETVERGLDAALHAAGWSDAGDVSIRRIDVPPLRLDPAATDAAIVERWARAWADAIVRRTARADGDVVRYASRVQALVDLVVSAGRGDFTRAWAWRQLGLWPADASITAADAAGLVLRALAAEARHAAAAIAWIARTPERLDRWLRRSSSDGLHRLALAVLQAGGGDPAALAVRVTSTASPGGLDPHPEAHRLLARSALAGALAQSMPIASSLRRSALALLVVAEAEPAQLRLPATALRELVGRIGAAWAGPGAAGDPAHAEAPDDAAPLFAAPEDRAPQTPTRAAAIDRAVPRAPVLRWAGGEPDPAPLDAAVAGMRHTALTGFAGLLFVLNLARDLGWPERLLRDPALEARGLRWTLHQLAQALLPPVATDPAALAFAGLRPDADPPGRGEPPAADAELAALARWRSETISTLRRRLRDADATEAELLDRILRRRAEIVADPGWIEIHLSLDDVRSDVRIAGLDLDPGWLPWLGVVIRFVYE